MTIAAGFKCFDGIVLCADTEETIGDISKRHVPKLRFEPSPLESLDRVRAQLPEMAVAFCGATNNGPFIDKIVDEAWQAVRLATALEEACILIEKTIKDIYTEFGQIYQRGYCPEADLIYGVTMDGRSKLFHAFGPIVNECEEYLTSGTGYYMADFISSRLYDNHLSLRQLVILAAYVLFQTKEHVPGCGGDSHIAVLRNTGRSGKVNWNRVETITELLKISDAEIGKLILAAVDFKTPKDHFLKYANERLEALIGLRETRGESLQLYESVWNEIFGTDDEPTED